MEVDADIEPQRPVLRVDWVAPRGDVFRASSPTQAITVSNADIEVEIGSAIFVDPVNSTVELAPLELLPSRTWLTRVQHVEGGLAVISDDNGRLITAPEPEDFRLRPGSIVECRDGAITTLISRRPFRPDAADEEDIDISVFMPALPDHGFERFYGSLELIERARELVELPIVRARELASIGARPIRGVLFSGPPGTGKTLLASLLAKEAQATFFRVSGPSLFRRYVGESEGVVRRIFAEAADRAPSIIFFDEIDALGGRRQEDSHDSAIRVISQLLTSMSEAPRGVTVIGATNRREVLDEALLRPGRFDREVRFSLPTTEARGEMLERFAAELNTQGPLGLGALATRTAGWAAADLELIFSEAAILAAKDARGVMVGEDVLGGLQRVARRRAEAKAS